MAGLVVLIAVVITVVFATQEPMCHADEFIVVIMIHEEPFKWCVD